MILKILRASLVAWFGLSISACDFSAPSAGPTTMPPSDIDGWAIWARPQPVLILVKDGGYHVEIQCQPGTLAIVVRNVAPAQAFPQPPMTVEINDFKWTGAPTALMDGDAPILTAEAYVFRENLPVEALIDGIRRSRRIALGFNGKDLPLTPIPAGLGKTFGDACERALWR